MSDTIWNYVPSPHAESKHCRDIATDCGISPEAVDGFAQSAVAYGLAPTVCHGALLANLVLVAGQEWGRHGLTESLAQDASTQAEFLRLCEQEGWTMRMSDVAGGPMFPLWPVWEHAAVVDLDGYRGKHRAE